MLSNDKIPNRLINETSPYLLQHSYNPVDWYPWGREAFDKAKSEDKPVFLSIGYSTCHWCHVMEEESFMDTDVAGYLNKNFISVKVDKEERPDIDSVYMTVCQAMTGSGGWPTTILMTPEQKPFFAGTYLPKRSRYGRFGLMELLSTVKRKWDTEPDSLIESGNQIAFALERTEEYSAGKIPPGRPAVEKAAKQLARIFDEAWGGFGEPPKFPMPHQLMFLLRCHSLGVSSAALEMTEQTLKKMYQGGIFDHVGFGFSRYSTDRRWLVPHFEKMLYDNALLSIAYTECYQVTGDRLYRNVAEMVFDYVERELTSPERGFYCAQDADSGGEEGAFYTFSRREVMDVLGKDDGERFCLKYDITDTGNFEGKNIPNRLHEKEFETPGDDETSEILQRLRTFRISRFGLHKDDKILTSWNALMIAAYAKAYRAFGDTRYLDRAASAFEFIETRLTGADGGLLISFRDGKSKGCGLLDDYAFLAWACIELYEAAFNVEYLEKACGLMDTVLERFSDKSGGFFLSPHDGEKLIIRSKERFDGAVPSGNSVAVHCLSKLSALTGEARWREAAGLQLAAYSDMMSSQPTSCAFALIPLIREVYPACELVCVAGSIEDARSAMRGLGEKFLPQMSVLIKTSENAERLARIAPFTVAYPIPDKHRLAFYLCKGGACAAPVYNIDELMSMINIQ